MQKKKLLLFGSILGILCGIYLMVSNPFVAPEFSKVISISAELFNRPDGGAEIGKFELDAAARARLLTLLAGAKRDWDPLKWQGLGRLGIITSSGTTHVALCWTGQKEGCFIVNGAYYRGGTDQEFSQLIEDAKRKLNEPPTPVAGGSQ
jgi:hypothetical protein